MLAIRSYTVGSRWGTRFSRGAFLTRSSVCVTASTIRFLAASYYDCILDSRITLRGEAFDWSSFCSSLISLSLMPWARGLRSLTGLSPSTPSLTLAMVVTRQRFSLVGDCDLSCRFCLATSLRAYCSCLSKRERGLSSPGRFLTSSVTSMLSSLGALSLPLLESP